MTFYRLNFCPGEIGQRIIGGIPLARHRAIARPGTMIYTPNAGYRSDLLFSRQARLRPRACSPALTDLSIARARRGCYPLQKASPSIQEFQRRIRSSAPISAAERDNSIRGISRKNSTLSKNMAEYGLGTFFFIIADRAQSERRRIGKMTSLVVGHRGPRCRIAFFGAPFFSPFLPGRKEIPVLIAVIYPHPINPLF